MRVVIEIENSYGEPVELFPPHDDDYYLANPTEVRVSPFVREFEGLDLGDFVDSFEDHHARCGSLWVIPDWHRWLTSGSNWCAWMKTTIGWLVIAEGRRHGIPWPDGFPKVRLGQDWPWQSCFDKDVCTRKPSFHAGLRLRRYGLPVPKERYVLLGFGRAPTLSWHYLDTQREDLLPWETATNG